MLLTQYYSMVYTNVSALAADACPAAVLHAADGCGHVHRPAWCRAGGSDWFMAERVCLLALMHAARHALGSQIRVIS